jgi:hypothetical protein
MAAARSKATASKSGKIRQSPQEKAAGSETEQAKKGRGEGSQEIQILKEAEVNRGKESSQGIASSHVPAIGAAIDNKQTEEPYMEAVFSGFEKPSNGWPRTGRTW